MEYKFELTYHESAERYANSHHHDLSSYKLVYSK